MRRVLFILGQLTDDDAHWLANAGMMETVPQGQVIIEEFTHTERIYILLDGEMVVVQQFRQGAELARLKSGDIIGEMSFVDASPASATVQAATECNVLAISKDLLGEKINSDTAFAARFFRAIAMFISDRLRALTYKDLPGEETPDGLLEEDELDENILDTVSQAGARFTQMLQILKRK